MSNRPAESKSDKKKRKLQQESPISQDGSDDSVVEELLKQYESYKTQFDEWTTKNKGNVSQEAYDKYVDDFKSWEKAVLGQIKAANKKRHKSKKRDKMRHKSEKSRDLVEVQVATGIKSGTMPSSTDSSMNPNAAPMDPMAMMMTMAMMMMPMLAQQQQQQTFAPQIVPIPHATAVQPTPPVVSGAPVSYNQFRAPPPPVLSLPDFTRPPPITPAGPGTLAPPMTSSRISTASLSSGALSSGKHSLPPRPQPMGGVGSASSISQSKMSSAKDLKPSNFDDFWYKKLQNEQQMETSAMPPRMPMTSTTMGAAPPPIAMRPNMPPPAFCRMPPPTMPGPPAPGCGNFPPLNPLAFPPAHVMNGAGPLRPLMDFEGERRRSGDYRQDNRSPPNRQRSPDRFNGNRSRFGSKDFSMKRRERFI